MEQNTIHARIKAVADDKNISIREIETHFHFANGTISKWNDNANLPKLKQVADYLNVSIDYLTGNEDNDKKQPVDIADDDIIMTYEGREIPKEDLEIIKRLLRRD